MRRKKTSHSPLIKSQQFANANEDEEVDDDLLNKALDHAIDDLQKASKKYEDENEDDMDEDEYGEEENEGSESDEAEDAEEERMMKKNRKVKKSRSYYEDDDEPDFSALAKSIPDSVVDTFDGADDVFDAVPFVKAMLDAVELQMTALVKAVVQLSDELDDVKGQLRKSARLEVAAAKMIKSVHTELQAIGDAPNPRKSVLATGGDIVVMRKAQGGQDKQLDRASAMQKLTSLHKSQKISLQQLITAEGRLQKGVPLDAAVEDLLLAE